MWGANMAVRRTAWEKVKTVVCLDDSLVHEDQDVSLWMAANGSKIMQDNSLVMTTDEDSYHYLPKIIQYYRLYKGTKKLHTENGNLASSKLRKIGFWRTLPGRMLAMVSGLYLVLFCSLLFFPIDYVVLHGPWKAKSIH
jgi:hypothetical protein